MPPDLIASQEGSLSCAQPAEIAARITETRWPNRSSRASSLTLEAALARGRGVPS